VIQVFLAQLVLTSLAGHAHGRYTSLIRSHSSLLCRNKSSDLRCSLSIVTFFVLPFDLRLSWRVVSLTTPEWHS
jgi:hypothetical protein